MKTDLAEALAITLMARFGLDQWSFKFDNAKRRFGQCDYTNKVISLSRPLVELNSDTETIQTIKHEIAHALEPFAGHGPRWQMRAMQLGCSSSRCYSTEVVEPKAKWNATCPCGAPHKRFREPTKRYRCRTCRHKLVWTKQA